MSDKKEELSKAPQIKAWIDNAKEQWEFWRVVAAKGGDSLLNKTEEEAKQLASYFEGKFDAACNFRDWLAQQESKQCGSSEIRKRIEKDAKNIR